MAVKALQTWCQKITEGYRDVKVTNMTTSWKDGLAFCAIIHHYRPDLINFDSLSKENIFDNNQLAFKTAERELGICALLDAEDMVAIKVPDKLSVVTYISQYYNYFVRKVPGGATAFKRHSLTESPKSKKASPSPKIKRTAEMPEQAPAVSAQVEISQPMEYVKKPSAEGGAFGYKCAACGKRVYIMERTVVDGKLYHRSCFRCRECQKTLRPGNYKVIDFNKFECPIHKKPSKHSHFLKGKKSSLDREKKSNNTTRDLLNSDRSLTEKQKAVLKIGAFYQKDKEKSVSDVHIGAKAPAVEKIDLKTNDNVPVVSKDHPRSVASRMKLFENNAESSQSPPHRTYKTANAQTTQIKQNTAMQKSPTEVSEKSSSDAELREGLLKSLAGIRKKEELKEKKVESEPVWIKKDEIDTKLPNGSLKDGRKVIGEQIPVHEKSRQVNDLKEDKQKVAPIAPSVNDKKDDKVTKDTNVSKVVIETKVIDVKKKTVIPAASKETKIIDVTKETKITDVAEKKKDNDVTRETKVIDTKEKKVAQETKVTDVSEKKKDNDVTKETKVCGNTKETKVIDTKEKKVEKETKVTDVAEKKKDSDVTKETKVTVTKEIKVDKETKITDVAEKKKDNDVTKETKVCGITEETKVIDTKENKVEKETKVSDVAEKKKDNDVTKETKVAEITENVKLDDATTESEASLLVKETKIEEVFKEAKDGFSEESDSESKSFISALEDLETKDDSHQVIEDFEKDESEVDKNISEELDELNPFLVDDEVEDEKEEEQEKPKEVIDEKKESRKDAGKDTAISEDSADLKVKKDNEKVKEKKEIGGEEDNAKVDAKRPVSDDYDDELNPFFADDDEDDDEVVHEEKSNDLFDENNPFSENYHEDSSVAEAEEELVNPFTGSPVLKRKVYPPFAKTVQPAQRSSSQVKSREDVLRELCGSMARDKKKVPPPRPPPPKVKSNTLQPGSSPIKDTAPSPVSPRKPPRAVSASLPRGQAGSPLKSTKTRAAPPPPPSSLTGSGSSSPATPRSKPRAPPPPPPTAKIVSTDEKAVAEEPPKPMPRSPKPQIVAGGSPVEARKNEEAPSRSVSPSLSAQFDESPQPSPRRTPEPAKRVSRDLLPGNLEDRNRSPSPAVSRSVKRKAPPPPPQRRKVVKTMTPEEIQEELSELDTKQTEMEQSGVIMEKKLREQIDNVSGQDQDQEDMLKEWFELINQKNQLVRRENELVYTSQDQILEEEYADVEYELRLLMIKPEDGKTEEEKANEEELIERLVEIVSQRNTIVELMEQDRLREEDEDKTLEAMMIEKGWIEGASGAGDAKEDTTEETVKSKAKKQKDKKKEKKKDKTEKKKHKKDKKSEEENDPNLMKTAHGVFYL
ncbi:uncharacterized protein LOC100372213 [Saccoglossus kowalevskii]